jgi:uncharacterized protein YxjI
LAALLAGAAYASPESDLRSAREIRIEEKVFNRGKDYDVKVDGQIVAKVAGKNFRMPWQGDVFTLQTVDGVVLASEKEHKRRMFESNRSAAISDGAGGIWGYIGEQKLKDLFK